MVSVAHKTLADLPRRPARIRAHKDGDTHTDRQANRQTDKQKDKQTDRHTFEEARAHRDER